MTPPSRFGRADLLWGLALVVAVVVAAPGVIFQLDRLLFVDDAHAAVDLRMRVGETAGWWAGEHIYPAQANAVYPPWGYVFMRALVLVPEMAVARVVWAVQMVVLLALAGWAFVKQAHVSSLMGRVFVALLPALLVASWRGAGNGQLHLLPVVCASGAVLLACTRRSWGTDIAAGVLFAMALTKPTSAAPFFMPLLFSPRRWRPAAMAFAAVGVTWLVASVPQPVDFIQLFFEWVTNALAAAQHGSRYGGSANIATTLWHFDLSTHGATGALVLWGGLAVWAGGRGRADVFAMLGVAGIIARISVYHRVYDDVLMIPALLALLRISGRQGAMGKVAAGLLIVFLPAFIVPQAAAWPKWTSELATAMCEWSWPVMLVFLVAAVEIDARNRSE